MTIEAMKLARDARLPACHLTHSKALERFAALVAAAEREACAQVCEQWGAWNSVAQECAAAIRARGEK